MPTAMAVMGRSARMESGSVAATSSSSARNVVGVKEAIGSTAGAELPAPILLIQWISGRCEGVGGGRRVQVRSGPS